MPFFITLQPTAPGFVFSPPFDPRYPDRLPKAARQDDWLDMSDVILDSGNLTVVSGRFREAVEALEPGIHAFHPLAMRDKAGETGFGEYFLFECGQTIPAVLSRKSGFDGRWQTDYFGRPYRGLSSAQTSGLFLSKPEIAGHHLFGNLFHGPSALVMSDELMARIEPLDLRHIRAHPVEAVDEAWDVRAEIGPWMDWVGENRDWIRQNQPATADRLLALYERYRARLDA